MSQGWGAHLFWMGTPKVTPLRVDMFNITFHPKIEPGGCSGLHSCFSQGCVLVAAWEPAQQHETTIWVSSHNSSNDDILQ